LEVPPGTRFLTKLFVDHLKHIEWDMHYSFNNKAAEANTEGNVNGYGIEFIGLLYERRCLD
jgi:hypothetical protein